jgi:hypothetical protein
MSIVINDGSNTVTIIDTAGPSGSAGPQGRARFDWTLMLLIRANLLTVAAKLLCSISFDSCFAFRAA